MHSSRRMATSGGAHSFHRSQMSARTRQKIILAGDVGGTKTNLGLFTVRENKLTPLRLKSFASKDYPGLTPLVQEFLAQETTPIRRACFGVAGPVIDGKCKTPNLPWFLDADEIARSLAFGSVSLINDLEATAYGLLTLEPKAFATLNRGLKQRDGNMALIAAGTGLGEAIIFTDDKAYKPLASEGGHADFAPRTAVEIDLLRYLMRRFGHVSYERALSGPGLLNIYNFLKDSNSFREPPWLRNRIRSKDSSAVISEIALAKKADICIEALDLFVSIYGAEAGNLALKAKAIRGVYIGGGIAPKILEKLRDGTFIRAFADKARFADFLSNIPVRVILNDRAALRGAAYYAVLSSESLTRQAPPNVSSVEIRRN